MPPTAAARQPAPAPTADAFARTVPFMYERHYFGETKQASMGLINVEGQMTPAEQERVKRNLSARKRILTSDRIRAIRHLDTEFRTFVQNAAACCWRPGLYLIPIGMVEVVDERAQSWEQQRGHLVVSAANELASMVATAQTELGPMFNPMDYPSRERFQAAYWVAFRFIDLGVPTLLREVRAEVFERERVKLERDAQAAGDMIRQHLRSSLLNITEHLAGLLSQKAGGKFPALREGALDDLNQFLATLELRDVTQDRDLRRVVQRLRRIGSGLDLEQLRDDDELRARTAAAMAEAKVALEGMVEDRGRGIRLREDGE